MLLLGLLQLQFEILTANACGKSPSAVISNFEVHSSQHGLEVFLPAIVHRDCAMAAGIYLLEP